MKTILILTVLLMSGCAGLGQAMSGAAAGWNAGARYRPVYYPRTYRTYGLPQTYRIRRQDGTRSHYSCTRWVPGSVNCTEYNY